METPVTHTSLLTQKHAVIFGANGEIGAGVAKEQIVSTFEQATLLERHATVADTARLAAFLASDGAATITGAIVNASSGRVID